MSLLLDAISNWATTIAGRPVVVTMSDNKVVTFTDGETRWYYDGRDGQISPRGIIEEWKKTLNQPQGQTTSIPGITTWPNSNIPNYPPVVQPCPTCGHCPTCGNKEPTGLLPGYTVTIT